MDIEGSVNGASPFSLLSLQNPFLRLSSGSRFEDSICVILGLGKADKVKHLKFIRYVRSYVCTEFMDVLDEQQKKRIFFVFCF